MHKVFVVVSDPWSFVDEHGSSTFAATVRAIDGDLVLLELAGRIYVASPRGEDAYNLIPTTADHSREAPPWGRDQWRGQPPALLADIHGL